MDEKNEPFIITKWEWFKINLILRSLECRNIEFYDVYYDFVDEEHKVICQIYGKHAETMIEQKASKKEQLRYYKDWVDFEKVVMVGILEKIPGLKKSFNLRTDVIFKIMYTHGKETSMICKVMGKHIDWKLIP